MLDSRGGCPSVQLRGRQSWELRALAAVADQWLISGFPPSDSSIPAYKASSTGRACLRCHGKMRRMGLSFNTLLWKYPGHKQ